MTCPDCCYGMRWRDAKHTPVSDLLEDVMFLKDLREITITGGEPTFHPEFGKVVCEIRQRLPKIELRIETNGLLYQKWQEVFGLLDLINVTHYTDAAWAGCLDNTKMVNLITKNHSKVRVMLAKHIPFKPGKGTNPCGRQERPHYSQRHMYGCCLYPGVFGSKGVPIGPNWQKELSVAELKCCNCPYAV